MIEIRKIRMKDWPELEKILRALVAEKPPVALELEPLIMKGPQWLALFPKGRLGHFVVALKNDKIIAFCYVAVPTYYKPIAYIGIAVAKKHRKQNIGAQLFYEVAQWASSQDIQYLTADIWETNTRSLRFFEHLGFEEHTRFEDKFRGELTTKIRLVRRI